MRRVPVSALVLVGALAAAPVAAPGRQRPIASASRVAPVGVLADTPMPSCPGTTCRTVTRTTGFQTRAGTVRRPLTVNRDGRVVALTLRIGNPSAKQVKYFDATFGSPAEVQLTVLAPDTRLRFRAVAESEIFQIEPYFGTRVQFPLTHTLPVKAGQIVAVTVPTWAPILAVGLDSTNSWRAARAAGKCDDFVTDTTQVKVGTAQDYRCLYSTARLTYTITLVTQPHPPHAQAQAQAPSPTPGR